VHLYLKILLIVLLVIAIVVIAVSFTVISTSSYDITGEIKLYSTATPPNGYLIANGDAVSRTTYSDLFAVIGTIYGAGDGSTTFNLPDLVQKFPRGTTTPGGTGGANAVALIHPEMPSHNHGITDPGHTHKKINWDSSGANTHDEIESNNANSVSSSVDNNNGHDILEITTTGITIMAAGSGDPHENLPPFLEILYIIKY